MDRSFAAVRIAPALAGAFATALLGACATAPVTSVPSGAEVDADELLIVDCLLPGQVRRLGTRLTYLSPRRPVKTSASICEIRGGEYVAHDRADFATALRIWLPQAEEGDAEAQTYVGEIYEKGLGTRADYELAAVWYRRAVAQGDSRASINLGYLYEAGLGVERDLTEAMNLYRRASGLVDGDLEYVSSIEYANREAATARTELLEEEVVALRRRLEEAEARYDERRIGFERARIDIAALREAVEAERARVLAAGDAADGGETAVTGGAVDDGADDPAAAAAEAERVAAEAEAARAAAEAAVAAARAENETLMNALERASTTAAERESELARLDAELAASAAATEAADAAALERRAELEARLDVVGGELLQARGEQTRLGARLRDAELEAVRRERGDAMIIEGLDMALVERERILERQANRIDGLQASLARTESRLAAAPDREEGARLERELAEQGLALATARDEQKRLTDRLLTEQLAARADRRESDTRLAELERTLAEREDELTAQRAELVLLESAVAESRVQLTSRDAEQVAAVVTVGPSIDIIDPPMLLTRGTPTLGAPDRSSIELIGKVDPAASLVAFKINGTSQPFSTAGVFRYFVARDARELELLAIDADGESTRLQLDLGERTNAAVAAADGSSSSISTGAPAASASGSAPGSEPGASGLDDALAGVEFGSYHALVIGNDDYRSLTDLNTAGEDARTVERVLRERYGFETELLLNATRHDMLSALARLREKLTPEDNLIVYYAGHGELDDVSRRGYWLPVDAGLDDTRNWISNAAITDQIDAMAAKHVMIVADSCYSGTLTRSSVARQPPDMAPELRARWYSAMAGSKVRTVLSSGGVRPVIDGAPGARHSIFAQAFIDELEANDGVIEAYSLFIDVQDKVAESARALNVEQSPQYSPIRHSGHEAGEFVFVANAAAG